jgi:exo-beta-1,3-glucanase (GH17 family)
MKSFLSVFVWKYCVVLIIIALVIAGKGNAQTSKCKMYGICFSAFINEKNPASGKKIPKQEILNLLDAIAPYTEWIRTYDFKCGTDSVGYYAHGLKLKVAAGITISNDTNENNRQIAKLIRYGKKGFFDIAIVGNEVFTNDKIHIKSSELLEYIRRVKKELPDTIPVTTADSYDRLIKHPEIIAEVDVVFAHIYAFWEEQSIEGAMNMLNSKYEKIKSASGKKKVFIAETGWPSAGKNNGRAHPSDTNLYKYFLHFVSWASTNDVAYFYFEAFDEEWKCNTPEGSVGCHWGIYDPRTGKFKPGMKDILNAKTNPCNLCQEAIRIPGDTAISFSVVPSKSSDKFIIGKVTGIIPAGYKVAVYIYANGGWWIKPRLDETVTYIDCDGEFECHVTSDYHDYSLTKIRAYLLSSSQTIPADIYDPVIKEIEQHPKMWKEIELRK